MPGSHRPVAVVLVEEWESECMPLHVIKGEYRIVGTSPDGDSVRFYADDPDVWSTVGIAARANATGGVQLRLDAVDALETHYTPPHGHRWHQPAALAQGASAQLLTMLGFTQVVRDAAGTVTSAVPDRQTGYILTGFADVYGRAVSLAFAGSRAGRGVPDGAAVYVGVPELRRSVNHSLLTAGWVYPTFYSRLFVDFREELAAVTVAARAATVGVWAHDETLSGATVRSATGLQDEVVLMPKLFRRLAEYLTDTGTAPVDLTGFTAFVAAHDDDRLYTVPRGQATGLDTLLKVSKQKLTLTLPPEQLVFLEQ